MKLQLADGHVEHPLGLLEHVIMTSCGIKYLHTFAVVDFGTKLSYDIILGRPFMRQLKVIQDWGSNHIYLRKQGATVRMNTLSHSFQDIARIPLVELDTQTSKNSDMPAWEQAKAQIWMCGASQADTNLENTSSKNKDVKDDVYFPEPFPEDEFEPLERVHILATLDTCTLETEQTQFCDEEGYDVIPLCMIRALEDEILEMIPINIQNPQQISTWDKSESSETERENEEYHDALGEQSEEEIEPTQTPPQDHFYEFSNQKKGRQLRYKNKRREKQIANRLASLLIKTHT